MLLLNKLRYKKTYEDKLVNLLISKYNFLSIAEVPRIKIVKILFFLKRKKYVFNFKMILLLSAFFNKFFKIFRNKLRLRGIVMYSNHHDIASFLYLFLLFHANFKISSLLYDKNSVKLSIPNLIPLFLLFESQEIDEYLLKKFPVEILFLFTKSHSGFLRNFIQNLLV